ncbi:MAG: hypothetical protein MSA33_06075 [Campylobacter sp.]|uniref:hypothetical protein n=1 Tax=Campylobacter sp. TaxID=205 RepID=UPI002AA6EF12|nr:hypothetical protein [Campylobacter sp.]MCI7549998.1 hypothetical protein [Campylobacter sp.]
MKKVLLALFLMFGFVSAGFSIAELEIIDESGNKQSGPFKNLEINIPPGSVGKYYDIKVTDLTSNAEFGVENRSKGNIILRFNAGVTSKRQIIYKVGVQVAVNKNSFASDYYALSSCQVDKSPTTRPRRSFLIMNSGDTKFLKFFLRDCDTGEIKDIEKMDLQTTLLALETQMNDNSVNTREQSLISVYGLPTVIIGQPTTRYLATKGNMCNRGDITSIELYDGNDKKIRELDLKEASRVNQDTKINFTIGNNKDKNYRKMHFRVTCKHNKMTKYYFDARPKEIKVSGLPNEGDWLYAEQKYKSDGSDYNDGFSSAINCTNCKVIENKLEAKKMKITLTPVDAEGKTVEAYNSVSEIAIVGKIYGDGTNAISGTNDENIINETKNETKDKTTLIRPCVAGSRAGCEIALAEIKGAKSEIYTDIVGKAKVLAYNNVGPTMLYGVDTEWTKYSQSQATPLCANGKSHSTEENVKINGNNHKLVGCNIPFVAEKGGDLNFYTFKPAVYKLLFEGKNSPANDSYGTDNLTYIHTIKPEDYDAASNEKIFEAADFNASFLAIGASLESLKNNRALSHYDNHLKVANNLKFSGNPANPTITIEGTSTKNNIAADFSVTASNETDISGAIILTLEPNNPYNHKIGYKDIHISTDITTDKKNITINMLNNGFYAGKNIKVNKLNFEREDLLARNYVHIGKSSVDIDMTKNTALSEKITDEKERAAFVFGYEGADLNFVDAAIIAPNLASNDITTDRDVDGAVYLAGYCDPTHAACSDIFISDAIAGHINYFGFRDIRGSATGNSLFDYEGATFLQFGRGADFLRSRNSRATIKLKGSKAREYCRIFRNCYELGDNNFGTTFDIYKDRRTQWHGSGDQGTNIFDGTARRKDQRQGF